MQLSWRGHRHLFLTSFFLEQLAQGHLTAFTPLLLADLGLAPAEIGVWTGLLFSITMGVALPLTPFWGALAERYSRRLVIVRASYLASVAYLLCFFAADVRWLVAARVLLGLTFGNVATLLATQAMITPRKNLGSAIGTIQAAQPVAASLGPPLGAALLPFIGLRGLFLLDGLLVLTSGLLVTFLMVEPAERDRSVPLVARARGVIGQVWRAPALRWNFFGSFTVRGASTIVDNFLPVRITQIATTDPAGAIGLILGAYGALTAGATWLVGRLVDRIDLTRYFGPAMLVAALCTAGLALATNVWLLGLLALVRSGPVAMSNTVLFTHLAQVLPRNQQTAVMSLVPLPRTIGGLLLPLLASTVIPLWPGAALAIGALGYAGAALAATGMAAATRALERRVALEAEEA